jgi:4-amino-4-deoxy-L-arabinose transferase-like glycosyltransferase
VRLREQWPVLLFLLLATAAVYLARNNPFFWDTVQLAGKHGLHYYNTNFSQLLLPQEIDSGHPPLFGMYIAACWKLFGQTLPVSHFAMLPFLWGIVLLLFGTGRYFGAPRSAGVLALLVFADPVLASQAVLVSPDVPLVFFFLLALWSILRRKPWWQAVAIVGLGLISMRGMMVGAMLYAWEIIALRSDFKSRMQALLPYLPGGLLAAAFLLWHHTATGWTGYHADSPWAPSFARVDTAGLAKNGAVLIWRMLDFGRVFVWIALLLPLWALLRRRATLSPEGRDKLRQALWLFGLSLPFLCTSLLLYTGLSAHRYLLPVFIALSLVFFVLITHTQPETRNSKLAPRLAWSQLVAILGLLCGNLWIYPPHISQGWDATLAHWPYYRLRQEAIGYLDSENIPLEQVGTVFPEIGPLHLRDLSGRQDGLKSKDFAQDRFILWSNVMNDFSDAETDALARQWTPRRQWKKGGVRVVLYER